MSAEEIKEAVEAANEPLHRRLDKLEKIARQRTLSFVAVALALLVAAVSVLYGINREHALQDQVTVNRVVVCAQAKSTALAPRGEPLAGESRNHYLNRLEAQREQLIAVGDLHCPSLPGFATLPFLRGRAITEIERILRRIAPGKLHKALSGTGAAGTIFAPPQAPNNNLPSSSPPGGGVGNGGAGSPGSGEQPSGPGPQPSTPQTHPPHHHPPPSGQPGSPPATGGGGGGGAPPASTPAESSSPPPPESPAEHSQAPESVADKAVGKACGIVGEVKAPALTVCPGH